MNSSGEDLKLKIALTLIPGVGNVIAKTLVSYCGSVEGIFKEKKKMLEKIPDIGHKTAEAIVDYKTFDKAESEIEFIEKFKIIPLFYLDKNYPQRLKNCSDSPVLLFYKGSMDLNKEKFVAIVGTRNATAYGKEITQKLVEDLKKTNATIVSGLAYGIDICAHKAALKNDLDTIGVLGHGLDIIYPQLHRNVALKMMEQGGLLTEFLSETKPDKENFPARNRIIAGISDAVIVVEAAKKGGALITAEIANSYNRDVFAVPGRVNDTFSEGCNHLVKINKAVLIESAKDIEYIMGWEEKKSKKEKQNQRSLFIELNPEEKSLIELLNKSGALNIDSICSNASFPVSKVSATLLNLEFKGVLKSLPGKMYELI